MVGDHLPDGAAPLRGTDLYYSGLLYSLAGKGEGALMIGGNWNAATGAETLEFLAERDFIRAMKSERAS